MMTVALSRRHRPRPRTLFALLAALSLQGTALSADISAEAQVVSPAAVRRLADAIKSRHPGLQALGLRAGAAREDAEAVRQWADPTLRAGGIGYGSRGPAPSEEGDLALGITQPLPIFGKESAARDLARAGSRTAQEAHDVRWQVLQRDLMERLLEAAFLNRQIDLATADLEWLRRISVGLEARLPGGTTSPAQGLRLRNEVSEAETRLRLQRVEARDAEVRINRVLGLPIDHPVGRWELPKVAAALAYRPEWSRQALASEPRLRLARKAQDEASARVEATRRSRRPNLSLGLDSRQYTGDGGLRNGSAILSLSLPWWNRDAYQRDLSRDRLRAEAAQREVDDLEAEVTQEIHHWVTRAEGARLRAELASQTLLPRIRAAQEVATAGLAGGTGDLREALDLRRQGLEAAIDHASALRDQWSAIAELLLLCGWQELPATVPSPERLSSLP